MKNFEPFFVKALRSPNKLLTAITNYIIRRKGKQMRPMLVFLAAKAVGEISDDSYTAATLIELLHTATLVHDDVVDETYQRRGQFSVNAIWNSKLAVLIGDFFLARGLQTAINAKSYKMLKIVSEAVEEISEGELIQLRRADTLDIDEETYYDIIRRKTATLIAACTKCGAISANASDEQAQKLYNYGVNLGIAFQIRDDIFDFEKSNLLGKPSGNDVKERKLTLPLIYALTQATTTERRAVLRAISRDSKSEKTVEAATELVARYGGCDYARKRMEYYSRQATDSLTSFQYSEALQSLHDLVQFNKERQK
jgi:octaprenyl-diphosphate synthase